MAIAMNAGSLRGTRAVEAGGAATESMGGVAVIILTILSLLGVAPRVLTPIAGIVFGLAFIVEGAAVAARQSSILDQARGNIQALEVGSGVTVEIGVGLAAVVLGVLSLIGIYPGILMSALTTAAGAGLMLSAGAVERLNHLQAQVSDPELTSRTVHMARLATTGSSAVQFLCGVAVTILGIMGLTRSGIPMNMASVGLLVAGCSITLTGTTLASRMLRLFQPNAEAR